MNNTDPMSNTDRAKGWVVPDSYLAAQGLARRQNGVVYELLTGADLRPMFAENHYCIALRDLKRRKSQSQSQSTKLEIVVVDDAVWTPQRLADYKGMIKYITEPRRERVASRGQTDSRDPPPMKKAKKEEK